MKILQKAKKIIEGLYRIYTGKGGFHNEEQLLFKQYYLQNNEKKNVNKQLIIVMVDGRVKHGGLSDRIRGIASIYKFCKERNITFRIHYTHPFFLEDYLAPATEDWRISKEDISFHPQEALPVFLFCDKLPNKLHHLYLSKILKNTPNHQIHVYTNTQFKDKYFKESFASLFSPVKHLSIKVEENIMQAPNGFVAIVFRFQQLLGDFKEGNYTILAPYEREQLIRKCIDKVEELHIRNHPDQKMLVTSDSRTFIDILSKEKSYVFSIPGEVVHMDYTFNATYDIYLKSFVDLLTLSKAQKIYLLKTGEMYKSGFAKRASKITNHAYEEIIF